jgi:hypothetical protein
MKTIQTRPYQTILVCVLAIVLLVTTIPVKTQASAPDLTLSKVYHFPAPTLSRITIDGQTLDTISLPEGGGSRQTGEPDLPSIGASLLIPQGTTVASVTVTTGTPVNLGSGYRVAPAQQPIPLFLMDESTTSLVFSAIYTGEETFPSSLLTNLGIQYFRGYAILELALNPIQYLPSTGSLLFYPDLTVTVSLTETQTDNTLYRGCPSDEAMLLEKIDNPEALASYPLATRPASTGAYSLLILTTDELAGHFTPLMDAHNAKGLPTQIKTLSDISQHTGDLTATDIRDFIRSEYIAGGIEYVLIGADDDVIPAQRLYVTGGSYSDQMPSDLYYACLDGTYDYDGDGLFGEKTDGENGGDVDLVAEVAVGRACTDDASDADFFVQKTIDYLNGPGITTGPSLMVGEFLWDPDTYGDAYMEELINGSSAHAYTTVGIPASQYTMSRLYDTLWGYPPGWPDTELVSRVNAGVRLINHLGHSSTNYNMRIENNQVDDLTNTIIPFVYSQGCYAGAFDDNTDDCIAEHWTVKTPHAGFAVVMCARYGWGVAGSTDGPNQRFQRYFWDAVFGEHITSLGWANQDSKEENARRINGQCMRWCYYEMNLFGDPALEFFPHNNTAPSKPAPPTGDTEGLPQTMYSFNASTTDPEGDQIYYRFSFGDGTMSPWLGPYESGTEVRVNHSWNKRGTYNVQVRAMDTSHEQSEWSDPLPVKMPYRPWWIDLLQRIFMFFQQVFARA